MDTGKKYKLATIIFAILYFTSEPTISDVYEDVEENVDVCQKKITDWETKYANEADSEEKTAALDAILEDCVDELADSNEQLQ